MFETMQGFLAFFIPSFVLICIGIIFEEKLIKFENALCRAIKKTINERRKNHVS